MEWFFKKHSGLGAINQANQADSFIGDSIKNLATAIVREGIQNALDARSETATAPVRVRIRLGTCEGKTADIERRWSKGLHHHLRAEEVGLPDPPRRNERCQYLVFEDFNTCGLTGDHTAAFRPGKTNNFVNFIYGDGVTAKGTKALGSKGVGKIVFTMASRARTMFALTVPEDSMTPLLVGRNTLKFREINEQLYESCAYFLESLEENRQGEPVKGSGEIDQFTDDFGISRAGEAGLSIVVPFIDEQLEEEAVEGDPDVSHMDDIRDAIIEHFGFAILRGELAVELDEPGYQLFEITAASFPEISDEDLRHAIELTRWAVDHPVPGFETLSPPAGDKQELEDDLVSEDLRTALRCAIEDGGNCAARVHTQVHPMEGRPVPAFFDVYFSGANSNPVKPRFIRELLPVSDNKAGKLSAALALIVVPSGPLADSLRAAEGPNHTRWSPRESAYQKHYRSFGGIAFVISAAQRLVELARGDETAPVKGIAGAFFSVATRVEGKTGPRGRRRKKGKDPEETPDLEPSAPPQWVVARSRGGFEIRSLPESERLPTLSLRVAYDVLKGSPWKLYDKIDFDLRRSRSDLSVHAEGATVRPDDDKGNRLLIDPNADQFCVSITGFDTNRDLVTDVRRAEAGTVQPADS